VCTRGREHLLSRSAGRTYGTTREHGMAGRQEHGVPAGSLARSHGNEKQPRTYRQSIRPRWHAGRPDPTGLFLVDMMPRQFRFPAHFFWLPSGDSRGSRRESGVCKRRQKAESSGRNVSGDAIVRTEAAMTRRIMPPARVHIT
jgi:hypothetical protein